MTGLIYVRLYQEVSEVRWWTQMPNRDQTSNTTSFKKYGGIFFTFIKKVAHSHFS